jgi:hypothetical protein
MTAYPAPTAVRLPEQISNALEGKPWLEYRTHLFADVRLSCSKVAEVAGRLGTKSVSAK